MPFGQAIVPPRSIINELYRDNAQNILEKTAVSNMVGLLQQLNHISLYASEIFGDILNETDKNAKRIADVKKRLNNIEQQAPKIEQMFADNAPSYFYDHPYTQREWQRRDPLHGLLFRRDRSSAAVNRRRGFAGTAPDFSVMDQFSPSGPCSKQYSDPNFFMNEWLEAEKRKMEEEREKRKQRKARKKKKSKRQVKTKILAVQKKQYNALGAEFEQKDPSGDGNAERVVKQYTLSGENGNDRTQVEDADSGPSSPVPSRISTATQNKYADQMANIPNAVSGQQQPAPPSAPMGGGGGGGSKLDQLKQLSPAVVANSPQINNGPPPAAYGIPAQAAPGGGGPPVPPPAPGMGGAPGGPPVPPPVAAGMAGGGPPPAVVPLAQPKRPLTGAEMAARSAALLGPSQQAALAARPAVQQSAPQSNKVILPTRSMDLLSAIKGGKKLKAVDPKQINRAKPMDARSMLLANLRGGATLKHVTKEQKQQKREEEVDRTVHAILQRRAFIEDDSDDETDSSWGSESD